MSPDLPKDDGRIPDLMARAEALNNDPVFCMMPWIHLHVMPDSTVTPCCVWPYDDVFADGKTQTLREVWNSEKMRQLRQSMLNGRPSQGCDRCYTLEKAGFSSLRKTTNQRFAHAASTAVATTADGMLPDLSLRYIDIRFSNLCNFRCRGCSPSLSSSWYEDHQRLYDYKSEKPRVVSIAADAPTFWTELKSIIPGAEFIYFGGGEPLIAREHFEVLKLLIDQGKTQIDLSYNTNLSTLSYGDHDLAAMWSKFRHVTVGVSLDDIGPRAEYFRKGTDWKIIHKNIDRLIRDFPAIGRYVNCTVSVHNAYYLPEIVEWLVANKVIVPAAFNVNMLLDPEEYVLHVLPKPLKDRIRQRLIEYSDRHRSVPGWHHIVDSFRKVIAFMDQTDDSQKLTTFRTRTHTLDKIRRESFSDVFPELREMMEP